ncbi:TadE-like protein [Rubripirellula amarantea]|uniref:TadE-like protein n=1 Tax=Rubripirellula amarantea TaxID=2527999 RepID=A0A5C5WI07_9BACT|nr:TadE family protein [Rubripirellula amarantea]TWT49739.1 TadE-like protein [Rubripirellula amarantea]
MLLSRPRATRIRQGTAVTELAVCLPVLVIIMLATIEACTMMHVQQRLKTTAFEGARVGIVPGSKQVNVEYQCELLLDGHKVHQYSVAMDPADPSTLNQGDWFTVTVEAPCGPNSLVGGWLYADKVLSRSVALRAE